MKAEQNDVRVQPDPEPRVPGWILVAPSALPERWRDRATPMFLVPLLPDEAHDVLAGEPAGSELHGEDLALAKLVARGVPVDDVARQLHLTSRTVYRRLARLRRLVGVTTTGELVAELARRGFR
ncbi:MAG TPA: helix-turn-helix domain-containing protein [Actinomycetota bacterium]|nr:helix-turn-helix domain-containing protein [Actinomycetota bacterium]